MRIGLHGVHAIVGLGLGAAGSSCPGVPLPQQTVYDVLRDAGFTADGARTMEAIAMRESSLNPSCIATSVAGSSEASYGLFQINMQGTLGPARRAQFGISDNSALLDPGTAARAAYSLSNGGTNFSPWLVPDTSTIPYQTRYLANLKSLPSDLELNYSGDATDTTTATSLETLNVPPVGDTGNMSDMLIPALIGFGLVYLFSRS